MRLSLCLAMLLLAAPAWAQPFIFPLQKQRQTTPPPPPPPSEVPVAPPSAPVASDQKISTQQSQQPIQQAAH